MRFTDWKIIDYKEAWDRQTDIFNRLVSAKSADGYPNGVEELAQVIFCEHPHVYTLGRNGNLNNLLIQGDYLASLGAAYYKTDRGGDITYHGYGQQVVYPILDLEVLKLSLKEYIHCLEEAVIQTLAYYGIQSGRLEGATGVWVEPANGGVARKICAIGVRASRYVSMHGLALNVNTDLSYYNHINPCGFVDKGVTSIQLELNRPMDMGDVKGVLKDNMEKWVRRLD